MVFQIHLLHQAVGGGVFVGANPERQGFNPTEVADRYSLCSTSFLGVSLVVKTCASQTSGSLQRSRTTRLVGRGLVFKFLLWC